MKDARYGRTSGAPGRAAASASLAFSVSSGSKPFVISTASTPSRSRTSSTIGRVTPTTASARVRHAALESAVGRVLDPQRPHRMRRLERPAVAQLRDPGDPEAAQGEADEMGRGRRRARQHAVEAALASQAPRRRKGERKPRPEREIRDHDGGEPAGRLVALARGSAERGELPSSPVEAARERVLRPDDLARPLDRALARRHRGENRHVVAGPRQVLALRRDPAGRDERRRRRDLRHEQDGARAAHRRPSRRCSAIASRIDIRLRVARRRSSGPAAARSRRICRSAVEPAAGDRARRHARSQLREREDVEAERRDDGLGERRRRQVPGRVDQAVAGAPVEPGHRALRPGGMAVLVPHRAAPGAGRSRPGTRRQ